MSIPHFLDTRLFDVYWRMMEESSLHYTEKQPDSQRLCLYLSHFVNSLGVVMVPRQRFSKNNTIIHQYVNILLWKSHFLPNKSSYHKQEEYQTSVHQPRTGWSGSRMLLLEVPVHTCKPTHYQNLCWYHLFPEYGINWRTKWGSPQSIAKMKCQWFLSLNISYFQFKM